MNLLFTGGPIGIPIGIAIAGIIFLVIGYFASKSNSNTQIPNSQTTIRNTGNVKITKTGWFAFAAICWVAAIVIYFYMRSEA